MPLWGRLEVMKRLLQNNVIYHILGPLSGPKHAAGNKSDSVPDIVFCPAKFRVWSKQRWSTRRGACCRCWSVKCI